MSCSEFEQFSAYGAVFPESPRVRFRLPGVIRELIATRWKEGRKKEWKEVEQTTAVDRNTVHGCHGYRGSSRRLPRNRLRDAGSTPGSPRERTHRRTALRILVVPFSSFSAASSRCQRFQLTVRTNPGDTGGRGIATAEFRDFSLFGIDEILGRLTEMYRIQFRCEWNASCAAYTRSMFTKFWSFAPLMEWHREKFVTTLWERTQRITWQTHRKLNECVYYITSGPFAQNKIAKHKKIAAISKHGCKVFI